MHVLVIRHGETEGNVTHVVQSRTPGILTARGIAQAEAVAKMLQHEPIDVVYCSDLQRCVDTAEIVLRHHAMQPFYTKRLRERNQGIYEGKQWEDIPWHAFEGDFLAQAIPGGESWLDMERRIRAFLEDVCKLHAGKRVLLVTHGGPIKAFRALLSGMTLQESVDVPVHNGAFYRWVMTDNTTVFH